ncbi:MAG: EAL domain-containing protein [Oscillospiraceae bacterium]
MSKKKEKKLKKLRKKHIWPSVVGLMLFSGIAFGIVATNLFTTLGYIVMAEFMDDFERAHSLAVMCSDEYSRSGNWDFVMERIGPGRFADSVALIDENDSYVMGYGERSFDLSAVYKDVISGDFGAEIKYSDIRLYVDNGSVEYGIFDIKNASVSVDRIIEQALNADLFGENHEIDLNANAFYCNYWIGFPVGDTGRQLIVRDDVYLRKRDLLVTGSISAIIGIMLVIPCVFMLINVIRDVISIGKVRRLIYTDTVTGGNNWLYVEHYSKLMKKTQRRQVHYALVDFCMRKYRAYCACHGVSEGEALLEQIDGLLQTHLRRGEMAAHYSEADFALVLQGKTAEEVSQRVHDITAKLTTALKHSHIIFHSGIYFADGSENDIAESAAQMYNYASSARHTISEREDSAEAVFNKVLLDEQLWEHHVEIRMDEALENEEFQVYLQPKYEPVDGTLRGAEALIRWISPEDGFVSPGRFIPIFERNGFITKIDDYMISHVAAQQAKWLAEGKPIVPVSVNISRAHFTQANLAEHIRELVDRYNVPHGVIEIELTESAFFDDKEALLSTVMRLKEYGFEISMDDFGAGYSSLNSLKDLPLDVLKLDAEFFRGDNANSRGEVVVSEAIKLAKSLDMRIVAEGVEKKEQVDFLARNGCDMIQGFYFAKPMPIGDFEQKHWAESPVPEIQV